jgi:hypothetical protein
MSQGIRVQTFLRASLLRRSTCSVGLPGLVAQGESVRLTRGRSLVRSQSGPQYKAAANLPIVKLRSLIRGAFGALYGAKIGPKLSAVVCLPVVERVQSRSNVVEFVVVKICVDVRRPCDRSVAHRLLQQTQICACTAGQGGIRVSKIVHTQRRAANLDDRLAPLDRPLSVLQSEPRPQRGGDRRLARPTPAVTARSFAVWQG